MNISPAPSALLMRNITCTCTACGELDQGEPVIRLRNAGHGPFRLFCFVHSPLEPESELLAEAACQQCDRPMLVAIDFRWACYCCERCRVAAANTRAQVRRRAPLLGRRCVLCEQPLGLMRRDALFCSGECRQRAWRWRRREGLGA